MNLVTVETIEMHRCAFQSVVLLLQEPNFV